MAMADMFAGVTVRESDDQEPLSSIYPLSPVESLTGEQEQELLDATRAAMRPLVEAEWARRGAEVRWTHGFVTVLLANPDPDGEDAARELHEDLKHEQVAVWGAAYDALDTDALWAQHVEADEATTVQITTIHPHIDAEYYGDYISDFDTEAADTEYVLALRIAANAYAPSITIQGDGSVFADAEDAEDARAIDWAELARTIDVEKIVAACIISDRGAYLDDLRAALSAAGIEYRRRDPGTDIETAELDRPGGDTIFIGPAVDETGHAKGYDIRVEEGGNDVLQDWAKTSHEVIATVKALYAPKSSR